MKQSYNKAFTIVELLIVVVVIAILAAITIVSYNGITNQAHDTAVQSDLRNTAAKIELYMARNGSVPSAWAQFVSLDMKFSKNSYAPMFNLDGVDYNFLLCHPTNTPGIYSIIAKSKSGNWFQYGTSGVGDFNPQPDRMNSVHICQDAGTPIPLAHENYRTFFYTDSWRL